jgi:hypothetical protein
MDVKVGHLHTKQDLNDMETFHPRISWIHQPPMLVQPPFHCRGGHMKLQYLRETMQVNTKFATAD